MSLPWSFQEDGNGRCYHDEGIDAGELSLHSQYTGIMLFSTFWTRQVCVFYAPASPQYPRNRKGWSAENMADNCMMLIFAVSCDIV